LPENPVAVHCGWEMGPVVAPATDPAGCYWPWAREKPHSPSNSQRVSHLMNCQKTATFS